MSENKENKLLESARKIFMQYGIKSVNMDDMAKHLGMSKKTLYLYVKDKEDLVNKTLFHHCDIEDSQISSICSRGLNAIDEQFEIMYWVVGMLSNVHPSILFDLQKYHPEVYKSMADHRDKSIYQCMLLNIKKGQKEGLYRKDLNPEIIVKYYTARVDLVFDEKLFPQSIWNLTQIYTEIFKYHIRGIASEKGLVYLQEKLKTTKL